MIADDAGFEGQARGVRVELEAPQSFVCSVNGEMIYRGLENVIRNAVKFTDGGGGTLLRRDCRMSVIGPKL